MLRTGLAGDDIAHILLSSVEPGVWMESLEEFLESEYLAQLRPELPAGMPAPWSASELVSQVKKMAFVNALMGLCTGCSQMPPLLADGSPEAMGRLGSLMARMRENLEYGLRFAEKGTPATPEDMAAYMQRMTLAQTNPAQS